MHCFCFLKFVTASVAVCIGGFLQLISYAESPALVTKHALAIGISDYDPDQFMRVPAAESDVTRLSTVLQQAGYEPEHTILMTNASGSDRPQLAPTKNNILQQLHQLSLHVDAKDHLVVAFSGHGLQLRNGQYCLCPLDADIQDVASLLPLDEILRIMESCRSERKLLLIDAMQATPLANNIAREVRNQYLDKLTSVPNPPANTAMLISCQVGQAIPVAAFESPTESLFFSSIITGLTGAAAGSDGSVTLPDLDRYVRKVFLADEHAAAIQPSFQNNTTGLWVLTEHSLGADEIEQIQDLIRQDRYDEAEIIADRILKSRPNDGRALAQKSRLMTYRAEQFRELERVPEALKIAEAAVSASPHDPLPYVARANAHRILQKYEKAFADATKAVDCDPNYIMAHVIRGFAYHHLHDLEGMGREAKIAIEIDPAHPEARALYAAYCFAKGQIDEGLLHLERAIAVTKNMPALYFLKGYALEIKKQHREAITQFTLAIELNDQIPSYYCRRALSHASAGNFAAALQDIAEAERIKPTYFDIASARAMVIQKQKGHGHSGQAIADGLRANPHSADLWQGKGFDLYTNRQYQPAIAAFQKALEINPGYGEAHMGIGMVYLQLKKYDDALIHLNRATRHKEHLARAYFEKSQAYIAKADYSAAINELQLALKYEPANSTYQQQLQFVQAHLRN